MSSRQSKNNISLDQLLSAIRSVKKQKQRPNPDRICQQLKRQLGKNEALVSSEYVLQLLEDAVNDRHVVKRLSRFDYSYEPASNSISGEAEPMTPPVHERRRSGAPHTLPSVNDTPTVVSDRKKNVSTGGTTDPSPKEEEVSEIPVDSVVAAVRHLGTCRRTDIEKHLKNTASKSQQDDHSQPVFLRSVTNCLDKALSEGRLTKDQTGRYRLDPSELSTCGSESTIPAAQTAPPPPPVPVPPPLPVPVSHTPKTTHSKPSRRPSGPKVMEEPKTPTAESVPANRRRHSAVSPEPPAPVDQPPRKRKKMAKPIPVCSFCLGDEHMNKRTGEPEDMVVCGDCGRCGHPTCLKWPDSLYAKVITLRWQCLQCKRCTYCGDTSKTEEDLLLCDGCDRGYHMRCCEPPLTKAPKGKWLCNLCDPPKGRPPKPPLYDDELFTPEELAEAAALTAVASAAAQANRQAASLQDGLSQYFKPSNKRSSRISLRDTDPSSSSGCASSGVVLPSGSPMQQSLLPVPGAPPLVTGRGLVLSGAPGGMFLATPPSATVISAHQMRPEQVRRERKRIEKEQKLMEKVARIKARKDQIAARREVHRADQLQRQKKRETTQANLKAARKLISRLKKQRTAGGRPPGRPPKSLITPRTIIKDSLPDATGEKKKRGRRPKSLETTEAPVQKRGPGRPRKITQDSSSDSEDEGEVKPKKRGPKAGSVKERPAGSEDDDSDEEEEEGVNGGLLSQEEVENELFKITDMDRDLFQEIQEELRSTLPPATPISPKPIRPQLTNGDSTTDSDLPNPKREPISSPSALFASKEEGERFPPKIQLGKYIVQTWYSSPYPSEYARLNTLYICEYCLKYVKSLAVYYRHMEKCSTHFPPGNEIYRDGDISVWEVDGYTSKLYCQSLCLLAKLFLDHKTLYYDVEPFLFYVLTICDTTSCHLVGYFSKEKHSSHKYNLSCLMVLPQYQKHNYGRFLIEFSYHLSRIEGEPGSPEKPLSELGRLSYESYWRSKLVPYVERMLDQESGATGTEPERYSISIASISQETGIDAHDVATILQQLSIVRLNKESKPVLVFDMDQLTRLRDKYALKSASWIPVQRDCLRWSPLVHQNSSALASPLNSPHTFQQPLASPHPTPSAPESRLHRRSSSSPTAPPLSSPQTRPRHVSTTSSTDQSSKRTQPSPCRSADKKNGYRDHSDSPDEDGGPSMRSSSSRAVRRSTWSGSRGAPRGGLKGSSGHRGGGRGGRNRAFFPSDSSEDKTYFGLSAMKHRIEAHRNSSLERRKRGRPRKMHISGSSALPGSLSSLLASAGTLGCLTVEIEEDEDTIAMYNTDDEEGSTASNHTDSRRHKSGSCPGEASSQTQSTGPPVIPMEDLDDLDEESTGDMEHNEDDRGMSPAVMSSVLAEAIVDKSSSSESDDDTLDQPPSPNAVLVKEATLEMERVAAQLVLQAEEAERDIVTISSSPLVPLIEDSAPSPVKKALGEDCSDVAYDSQHEDEEDSVLKPILSPQHEPGSSVNSPGSNSCIDRAPPDLSWLGDDANTPVNDKVEPEAVQDVPTECDMCNADDKTKTLQSSNVDKDIEEETEGLVQNVDSETRDSPDSLFNTNLDSFSRQSSDIFKSSEISQLSGINVDELSDKDDQDDTLLDGLDDQEDFPALDHLDATSSEEPIPSLQDRGLPSCGGVEDPGDSCFIQMLGLDGKAEQSEPSGTPPPDLEVTVLSPQSATDEASIVRQMPNISGDIDDIEDKEEPVLSTECNDDTSSLLTDKINKTDEQYSLSPDLMTEDIQQISNLPTQLPDTTQNFSDMLPSPVVSQQTLPQVSVSVQCSSATLPSHSPMISRQDSNSLIAASSAPTTPAYKTTLPSPVAQVSSATSAPTTPMYHNQHANVITKSPVNPVINSPITSFAPVSQISPIHSHSAHQGSQQSQTQGSTIFPNTPQTPQQPSPPNPAAKALPPSTKMHIALTPPSPHYNQMATSPYKTSGYSDWSQIPPNTHHQHTPSQQSHSVLQQQPQPQMYQAPPQHTNHKTPPQPQAQKSSSPSPHQKLPISVPQKLTYPVAPNTPIPISQTGPLKTPIANTTQHQQLSTPLSSTANQYSQKAVPPNITVQPGSNILTPYYFQSPNHPGYLGYPQQPLPAQPSTPQPSPLPHPSPYSLNYPQETVHSTSFKQQLASPPSTPQPQQNVPPQPQQPNQTAPTNPAYYSSFVHPGRYQQNPYSAYLSSNPHLANPHLAASQQTASSYLNQSHSQQYPTTSPYGAYQPGNPRMPYHTYPSSANIASAQEAARQSALWSAMYSGSYPNGHNQIPPAIAPSGYSHPTPHVPNTTAPWPYQYATGADPGHIASLASHPHHHYVYPASAYLAPTPSKTHHMMPH